MKENIMAITTFSGPVSSLNGFIGGTATDPIVVTTAENINESYATTSAASGDTRLSYNKLTFTGAGAGETLRAFSVVTAAQGAGQTTNGAHISMSVNTGGSIAGAGNALRATLGLAAGVSSGGTVAAIQADSDVGAGATLPSNASWIRFTNSGAGTGLSNLFNVPAAMVANAVSVSATKTIKIVDSTGTAYYLMVSAAA
jgi:hypothetical protein